MDRLLQNVAGKIEVTLLSTDGAPVDADGSLTVDIYDGAGVHFAGPFVVADHPSTGVYRYTLPAASTAIMDVYKAVWTDPGNTNAYVTRYEVVGGLIVSVGELRAFRRNKLADPAKYLTADLIDARETAEAILEYNCGVGFTPRSRRWTLAGFGSRLLTAPPDAHAGWIIVPDHRLRRLYAASIDGVAVDVNEITVEPSGRLYRPGGWGIASLGNLRNVSLHYEHGYDEPPPRIVRAAKLLVLHEVVESSLDDRTISITDEVGTRQIAVPGGRFGTTGIPEVDATIGDYDERLSIA